MANKNFPDKKKPKEFIITKPLLYEMLKGSLLSRLGNLSKKKKIKTINNNIAINLCIQN